MLGDTVLQIGELKNENVVALLPDDACGIEIKDGPLDKALHALRASMDIDEEDGWLCLQPKNAASERAGRVTRRELGKYLRAVATRDRLRLDERAKLATYLPDDGSPLAEFILRGLLRTSEADKAMPTRMLKFYGLLSETERTQAMNGGLPLGSLAEGPMRLLLHEVYGARLLLQLKPYDGRDVNEMEHWQDRFYQGLLSEPTEAMPNGIAPDRKLTIVENREPGVYSLSWHQNDQFMNAHSYAWQRFMREHPENFHFDTNVGTLPDISKVRFGTHHGYEFIFSLTDQIFLPASLDEDDFSITQAVTLDALPSDFQADYLKNYAQIEKQFQPPK